MTSKGRPTLYRGIRMRSRLEASYAAHLDATTGPAGWEYEPECFAGPGGQWLPDFRVGGAYVELKPSDLLHRPPGSTDKVLRDMTVAWLSEPGCALRLQFWTWGATWGAAVQADRQGDPWRYVPAGGKVDGGIWAGMGQADKCPAGEDFAAEQRMLQGALLTAAACRIAQACMTAADFTRPQHQLIYRTVLAQFAAGAAPNPIAVADELGLQGKLRDVGGAAYLYEILAVDPPEGFAYEADARHLHQLAANRSLRGLRHDRP
jgi:hypothetical protein